MTGTPTTADAKALRAVVEAAIGCVLGVFAFKLQLGGGDEHFLTYALGLLCTGFFGDSLKNLAKALATRTPAQGGANLGRVAGTAFGITLVGICLFPLCSILAVYLDSRGNLGAVEILIGLVTSVTAFAGPFVLGIGYFMWLQQALADNGFTIAAAVFAALVAALGSVFLWYFLNITYGPRLYQLLV